MSNILYDPKKKEISKGDYIEMFDCGVEILTDGVDSIIPLLVKLKTGEYTLQQAYDKYILYKVKGYL